MQQCEARGRFRRGHLGIALNVKARWERLPAVEHGHAGDEDDDGDDGEHDDGDEDGGSRDFARGDERGGFGVAEGAREGVDGAVA